jgi:hypothetical protein
VVGLVAATTKYIGYIGCRLVIEYLMKNFLFNLTKRAKINSMTRVLDLCLVTGCAQQHSLQEIENSFSGFYGAKNDNGELFSQQSVPSFWTSPRRLIIVLINLFCLQLQAKRHCPQ